MYRFTSCSVVLYGRSAKFIAGLEVIVLLISKQRRK
jgi:hypothetical protein